MPGNESTAAESTSESRQLAELRDRVLSNSVVWRKLGRLLNFGDLKVCRLVSRDFNRKIVDETNFKSRCLVRLKEEDLKKEEFGRTTEKWKNLTLPVRPPRLEESEVPDMNWLYPLMEDVENLALRCEWMDESAPPFTEKLLQAPKSLNRLSIDPSLLGTGDQNIFQSNENVLSRLRELELKSTHSRPITTGLLEDQGKSLEALASTATNLNVLKVSAILPENMDSTNNEVDEDLQFKMQCLVKLVEANRSHLSTLDLSDIPFWSTSSDSTLDSVTKHVFPALKSIKIRASQLEAKTLEKFLKAQPPLEEIDITVLNQFPNQLLQVLRERGENLRALRIKTKGFAKTEENMWKFLSELKLEEFHLNLIQSEKYSLNSEFPPSVFSNLPGTIQKIFLRGLPISWEWECSLTSVDFANISPAILTVLNLSQCGTVITDVTAEFICRNLRMLQDLNLSNAESKLTDYGFTGRSGDGNEPEFCLSNLKGLKYLTLRSCGNITDDTLKFAIKFQELRFLDVSNNRHLTTEGYLAALRQNASLEELKTSEIFDETFPSEEELRKSDCPRLKYHQFSDGGGSDDEDASENHHYIGSGSGGSFCLADEEDYDNYFDEDYEDDYENSDDAEFFFG